jgi:hypothetical protein
MKRTILAATIGLVTLFSTSGQADIVNYIESGNDGLGDSFKITFQYDNTANTVVSVSDGSFTDSSGTYNGVTTLVPQNTFSYGNGATAYQFTDASANPNLVAIILNTANTIPLVNSTPGFYAFTTSQAGQITYNNAPKLVDPPVPLPSAIWMFGASLAGLLGLRQGVKQIG